MNFFEKVYEVVKSIPYGKVMTYGEIAELLGNKKMSRQVGWALHVNPNPDKIPCYRVVNRFGQTSKAFAFGGEDRQKQLLEQEGIIFDKKGCVKPCFFAIKRI
ncbi:MAG: MGMT family protein [Clostridia bacterium]|nr:MGMT family protein [Clostridia bacterium]